MSKTVWGRYSPKQGKIQQIAIGPLLIHIQWFSNEIWIASRYVDWTTTLDEPLEPVELDWSRFALSKEDVAVELAPSLPKLPLLLKPDDSYRLSPDAVSRMYTRIPLSVQIRTEDNNHLIAEIPTLIQSNTWFGSVIDGELCLSHTTSARRVISDDFFMPHLIGSILEIRNNSKQDLKFDKICLRTDAMTIYSDDGQLWTDTTVITYEGSGSDGHVVHLGKAPKEAPNARLISNPRVQRSTSLALKTFELIRDIRF
jgi:hypothetical protein